jgi:hypothetical protein
MGGRTEAPPGSSAGRPNTSGGDEPQPGSKKKKQPKVRCKMECFHDQFFSERDGGGGGYDRRSFLQSTTMPCQSWAMPLWTPSTPTRWSDTRSITPIPDKSSCNLGPIISWNKEVIQKRGWVENRVVIAGSFGEELQKWTSGFNCFVTNSRWSHLKFFLPRFISFVCRNHLNLPKSFLKRRKSSGQRQALI